MIATTRTKLDSQEVKIRIIRYSSVTAETQKLLIIQSNLSTKSVFDGPKLKRGKGGGGVQTRPSCTSKQFTETLLVHFRYRGHQSRTIGISRFQTRSYDHFLAPQRQNVMDYSLLVLCNHCSHRLVLVGGRGGGEGVAQKVPLQQSLFICLFFPKKATACGHNTRQCLIQIPETKLPAQLLSPPSSMAIHGPVVNDSCFCYRTQHF